MATKKVSHPKKCVNERKTPLADGCGKVSIKEFRTALTSMAIKNTEKIGVLSISRHQWSLCDVFVFHFPSHSADRAACKSRAILGRREMLQRVRRASHAVREPVAVFGIVDCSYSAPCHQKRHGIQVHGRHRQ